MNTLVPFLAALALAAPHPAGEGQLAAPVAHESAAFPPAGPRSLASDEPQAFSNFRDSYQPQVQDQVHIEQRVIIRIAPGPPQAREDFFARFPRPEMPPQYREERFKGCVAIDDIAGVEPVEDRLVLYMRDHRLLSAALERACDAEAFYLGFYVERNADGMLCSKRDKLQARTGATCQIIQLNRLVAVKP